MEMSIQRFVENFVLGNEKINGKYNKNDSAYLEYIKALNILKDLESDYPLTFEADNPNEPYVNHTIVVEIEDDPSVVFPTKPLRKILKRFKEISINTSPYKNEDECVFTFMKTIYTPAE